MSCNLNDPEQVKSFIVGVQWNIPFLRLFQITRALVLFFVNNTGGADVKSISLKSQYQKYSVPKKMEKVTGGDVPHDLLVFFRYYTINALGYVKHAVNLYKHHCDFEKDLQELFDVFTTLLTNNDCSIDDCVGKFVEIIRNSHVKRKRQLDQ